MFTFRRLEMSDLPFVREMIADVRYGNSFSMMSPERAEECFRFYIGRFLTHSTFAEVCEVDGVPAGFLLGTAKGEEFLFKNEDFPTKKAVPWWLGLTMFKISKMNEMMIEECKSRGFDSEVLLYVTDEKFRGQGVITALMGRFGDYLVKTGHKHVFLCIDDYYKVEGHYLKRGFKEEFSIRRMVLFKKRKFTILSKEL